MFERSRPGGEMMISGSGRAKRVTDPFDDKVKARLRGYFSSSGSEHDAESSDLVDGFFFSENVELDDFKDSWKEGNDRSAGGFSDAEELQSFDASAAGMIRDLVNWGKCSTADEQNRRDLVTNVSRSAENFLDLKRKNRSAFLRAVMASLREIGYNAGICKSRWESGGGVLAGSYEYIDVVDASNARYIVDVDFAGEFDIARPTPEYGRISGELPRILVARPEILRQLLRILAEAARRSLRHRELSIPPWRKTRFMQAKWLGPYLRTLNYSPSSSPSSSSAAAAPLPRWRGDVKCKLVGFDAPAAFIPTAVIPPA